MKKSILLGLFFFTTLAIALGQSGSSQVVEPPSFHDQIFEKIVEGGWQFMSLTMICLLLGLTIFINKIFYISTIESNKEKIINACEATGGIDDVEGLRTTLQQQKGTIPSVLEHGLDAIPRGLDKVQENLLTYASIEKARLESGLPWLALFISLAPMLGFMGTVIGMIDAFDGIASLDASQGMAGVAANGIKVALITTVSGLVIAVILQLFYNYLTFKIENFNNDMEDTISYFMDFLVLTKAERD
ncbi:MAG: MotA/TolQ/ExbB proton channel family protein [Cytophagales bacterium]|nr:MotA/TolQ/ExbB proton channel family protein [Cytophagales bacterium]